MKTKLTIIALLSLGLFSLMVVPALAEDIEEPPLSPEIPGRIEETGTLFEITNSEYLNVSLESTEEITVILESVPKTISLYIQPLESAKSTATAVDPATLTISNLEPNKTYYKFENSYKNKVELITDESGGYSWTQDTAQTQHIWFQPEYSNTIFLPGECSLYGDWDEPTSTCILTQGLTENVEITASNITLDCDEHSIGGFGSGYGIYLYRKTGTTIKNCTIKNFSGGIYLYISSNNILNSNLVSSNYFGINLGASDNNALNDNTVLNNTYGIALHGDSGNNILNNNTSSNNGTGIYLFDSAYSILTNNKMFDNQRNFFLDGTFDSYFDNSIDTSNTVDGKPIYYIKNAADKVYDSSTNTGVFYCIFCNNVTIRDLILTKNGWGVFFWKTQNSKIENVNASENYVGIHLNFSNNNILNNNIANSNKHSGVILRRSNNNTLLANTTNLNTHNGIWFNHFCDGNILNDNNINSNFHGIDLHLSDNNTFNGNTITNNLRGIWLYGFNNKIYHNNFIDNSTQVYIYTSTGNLFDNGYPDGGNYWSDYTGVDLYSGPNQDQAGSDGIGDILYSFTGGQDRYPFIEENGWGPVNQPPSFSDADQYKSDEETSILEGNTTTESTVVFKAIVSDPDNDKVKLQVQIKEVDHEWQDTIESDLVNSGSEAVITKEELSKGQYMWRARATDDKGAVSGDWQEFGTSGNVDFIIKNLEQAAADLANKLVNSVYLYGGKGWDYNQSKFVAPTIVKTGYSFWNQELENISFGAGVDCSGLIMWSYNRSFDPLKSRFDNFVKAESADEQYRYNTEITTEAQLRPGNVMFFDWDSNSFIDHVAMYVGDFVIGDEKFDVVQARSRQLGIVSAKKDNLKQQVGFTAFKQVVSALPPAVLVLAHSPVDLIVTDPDGFTITPTTIVNSDLEYLREIPGILYYSEMEKGIDGNPIDQVYSYTSKTGDYTIQVLPASGTPPTTTYALDFTAENQSIALAQNVSVSQIPTNGYGIIMSETGAISSFIPVTIDIKPGSDPNTINLKSKGVIPVAVLTDEFFNAEDVVIDSVVFAKASPTKRNLEDIDNDDDLDLILHFEIQDLQLTLDDAEVVLTGSLIDEALIKGIDFVKVISPGKSGKQIYLLGVISLCIIGIGLLIRKKKIRFPSNIIERIRRIKIKK